MSYTAADKIQVSWTKYIQFNAFSLVMMDSNLVWHKVWFCTAGCIGSVVNGSCPLQKNVIIPIKEWTDLKNGELVQACSLPARGTFYPAPSTVLLHLLCILSLSWWDRIWEPEIPPLLGIITHSLLIPYLVDTYNFSCNAFREALHVDKKALAVLVCVFYVLSTPVPGCVEVRRITFCYGWRLQFLPTCDFFFYL